MAFLGVELSPDSKNFENIKKGTFKAKISPSGMVLSRPKRVPGRCLMGHELTGAPGERHGPTSPPHTPWIRYCSSASKIEIILHSLCSRVIPPCALWSCRQPHPSKAPKSVWCPVPPPRQPPLGRSRGLTMYSLISESPSWRVSTPVGLFLTCVSVLQVSIIVSINQYQYCYADLDPPCAGRCAWPGLDLKM